jgi:hypothetical protein
VPLAWWRKPDCNMEAGLRCAIKLLDRLSSLPECVFQHRGGDPIHKPAQDAQLACRFASEGGSRSAPIRTPPVRQFLHACQNSMGSQFGTDSQTQTRRHFLATLPLAGAAALARMPQAPAAEERVETTALRLLHKPSICGAPWRGARSQAAALIVSDELPRSP